MPNNIKLISKDLLSSNWGKLFKVKYKYQLKDGSSQIQQREVYDRGNGAVIFQAPKAAVLPNRQTASFG